MKLLGKFKNVMIIFLFIILSYIFNEYKTYYVGKELGNTLITVILIISFLLVIFILTPVNKEVIGSLKKNKNILFIPAYLFILEFIFVIENKLQFTNVYLFSVILVIYILSLISAILTGKIKHIYNYTIIIFLPIYMIMQDLYIYLFSDFFSIKEIVTIKEGMAFASGVMHFKAIFVLYITLMLSAIFIYNKLKTNEKIKINYKMFMTIIIFIMLVRYNEAYPVKEARLYTSDSYLYKHIYSKSRFISRFGVSNYLVRDITDSLSGLLKNNDGYKNEIDNYFKENTKVHFENDYSGIFKDKNLIFILAESFDYIALNETLTPNISKLMNEGLYFDNFYVPVYPRTTCDTEIIFNTGLIPSITEGPTCYTYNKNSYNISLANLFKQNGYQTKAFHSNNKEFYTRNLVYKGLGYDKFYGQKELDLSEEDKRFDSVFFEKAKDYIVDKDNKFMSFVITLSGHSPYNKSHLAGSKHYSTVKEYYKDENIPEEVLYYIATQIEVDKFIELLIEDLRSKNILDDTVIIFSPDHYPYTIKKDTYEEYTNIKEKYLKNKEPLIIWSNQISSEVISKVSQSLDVIPTIANLFDLPVNYSYYFGNDILGNEHEELVYYKDYSWYDGENYVQYGNKINGSGSKNHIKDTTKKVDSYFDISKKILESDYFK